MARRILDETTKSTFSSDDFLYMDGQTDGASKITPDNLVRNTTVAQQLAQHIADAEDEVEQITADIEGIQTDINDVKSDIGDLEDLDTTDKSSLVGAINEAASSGGGGSIDTLTDVELTNLSNGQALTYDSTEQVWKNVTLGGGGSVTIDSALSGTSTNPVQNKVIKGALDEKANTTDLAQVATSGSYNDLSDKPTIPSISGLQTQTITDAGGYFSTDTVEAALQQLGAELDGVATLLAAI